MTNKRLFAILITFFVLAGIAVVGSAVFKVKTLTISFTNVTDYIDESAVTRELTDSVAFVKGKNILFGVDRDLIKQTIEDADFRVRFTNIEAKFPNRLEVKVRERYLVFYYKSGDNYLLLDGDLRIMKNAAQLPTNKELVDLTSQLLVDNIETAEEGHYLTEYLADSTEQIKAEYLEYLTPLFASRENYEDSLNHLFTKIEFYHADRGAIHLELTLREGLNSANSIRVEVQDIQTRFNEKLTYVWHCLEEETIKTGHYKVYIHPETGILTVAILN